MMVKLHKQGRMGILGFLVAGLLALTAGVFTGVGSASAHSPQIVANADCDGVIHYTVTSWTTGLAGENPDILVYYKVENTGPAVVVTHGSFSAANGYQFAGTTPWPGDATLVVMFAEAVAPWADGAVTTGNYWTEWVRPSCSGTTTTAQATTTTAQETTTTAQATTTTTQETTTTTGSTDETTTTVQETTTSVDSNGPTTTVGATTTSVGSGGPTTTAVGSGSELPRTGSGSMSELLIAAGLVLIGCSVVLGTRRRHLV